MRFQDCPVCGWAAEADENAMFWCERCELAWFRWSREQEARRLDGQLVIRVQERLPLHLVS